MDLAKKVKATLGATALSVSLSTSAMAADTLGSPGETNISASYS